MEDLHPASTLLNCKGSFSKPSKWSVQSRFGSQHNQGVATEIIEKIIEHYDKKYDEKLIGRELLLYRIVFSVTRMLWTIGAVHRHYESRWRVFNDLQPGRQAVVLQNKEKAKRKGYWTRVCIHIYSTAQAQRRTCSHESICLRLDYHQLMGEALFCWRILTLHFGEWIRMKKTGATPFNLQSSQCEETRVSEWVRHCAWVVLYLIMQTMLKGYGKILCNGINTV